MTDPLEQLTASVSEAAAQIANGDGAGSSAQVRLERPKHAGQGDYSTNAAMLLAPSLKLAPRVVAERIGSVLTGRLADEVTRVEVAGPGFLNVFLTDGWYRRALAAVTAAGEGLGAGAARRPERILVEFISANPTGPLVAVSGRAGAFGDALARILEHHGHTVAREYYFNDAGNQIRLLGESVQARARGEEVPEGGYEGDYVRDLAAQIPGAAEGDPDEVAHAAVELLLTRIKATLERYGVHYDNFFSERTLHQGAPNAVERALTQLGETGHTYRSEGALWLRTTKFGDDKDRVLVRSNGAPTYLAADVAYLLEKRERGYDRQLIPVGSDHDTWARTMKHVMQALGGDPDSFEAPLIQFVHLISGGEAARMSKRRGVIVTLDDLLDEIGVDATRFFMLQRSHDRTLDLDLDLARTQSRENPVYYVQYAHARIASMLGRLDASRIEAATAGPEAWSDAELQVSERDLIKRLIDFPAEIREAAERRAPHRITGYALALAQDFTTFYEQCRVVGATPAEVESLRIALSAATQRVIALTLRLLGVSAPRSM
jgi:arginyl-tRNA synthetase